MDGQLVKSLNIWLDSDMPHDIGSSTGDSFDVQMNSVNIDSAQGQFVRLSVTSFSMFKNFPNVNQYNSQFVLHNSKASTTDAVLNLRHQNYGSYTDLATEFMNKIKDQLQVDHSNNSITATLTSFTAANQNTTDRIISFDLDFTNAHSFATTTGNQESGEVKVLFHEHYPSANTYPNQNSDIYALLGGDRNRKSYSANNSANERQSINVRVPNNNKITFTCKYPMQLYTEQFVYLHCDSFQGNNLESTSLRKFDGTLGTQSKVCDLHHSTILGRFPIQHEFIHYDAQSEREFFVDLPTNLNHLNYAKFRLTGSHGRNLHFTENQSTLGNLNFSMVLRCDIIQKFNPNQPFTKEKERTVPPRYSNVQIDYNGHNR